MLCPSHTVISLNKHPVSYPLCITLSCSLVSGLILGHPTQRPSCNKACWKPLAPLLAQEMSCTQAGQVPWTLTHHTEIKLQLEQASNFSVSLPTQWSDHNWAKWVPWTSLFLCSSHNRITACGCMQLTWGAPIGAEEHHHRWWGAPPRLVVTRDSASRPHRTAPMEDHFFKTEVGSLFT